MEKSDCMEMLINEEELPLSVLKKLIIPALSPNDHSRKKIAKRKSRWSSDVTQKKAKKGELATEITKNVLNKENVKNELLGDIEKTNLTIEEVNVLQFILQTFKDRMKETFKNDSGSEDKRKSKKKEDGKTTDKSNLSVTESGVESNLSKTKDNFAKIIEIKHVLEPKQKTMEEPKSDKKTLNELEGIKEKMNVTPEVNTETKLSCPNAQLAVKPEKAHCGDIDILHIREMLINKISIGAKRSCIMAERVEEDLSKVEFSKPFLKVIGGKSDFVKMPGNNEGPPLVVAEELFVPFSSPKDHSPKKIAKKKSRWTSDMIQKKVKKKDCSSKTDEIEKEQDNGKFELNDYVEHDKNYFFVHSAEIGCKLCNFKGILIVQHYKTKHPESEVLISRTNPDIAEILIEDAVRNCEEYNKGHPKLEKMTCNLKCPFCLMLIKDIRNAYYNHISSHTGEYEYDHMNQMHFKIQKTEESKYVFGHICSKCNFIQLIRAAVEEHVMVHHLGMPEIHRVNLGFFLHEDTLDENCMDGIHSNEKHSSENLSNLNNCIDVITSGADKIHNHNLKIPVVKELNVYDPSLHVKELEEVKVKTKPNVLEDDLHPIEFSHTDMDIKQESESDTTEILQRISENANEVRTSISDQLQTKLLTELVEESEKEVKEEPLSSELKFPVIASVQSLALKSKQFVLTSGDNSKCTSILTEIPITDIKKQNRECQKGVAVTMKPSRLNTLYKYNINLVPPYNCEDDGFLNCSFKTLYFDEYLKHVEAIHQVNEHGSFSSEHELQREAIMEGWLAKQVGPFQCRYCKKATVTHQEMQRHQAVFHNQEQCWFYYRKFVPNDAVTTPEQVNLEDLSFINHVIHLPHQIHLCDFKLTDGLFSSTSAKLTDRTSEASWPQSPSRNAKIDLDLSEVLLDEPEIFSIPVVNQKDLFGEFDPLCLEKPLKDSGACNDAMLVDELMSEALDKSTGKKCRWEGCYEIYHFQTFLVKHLEKDHVGLQRGEKFPCLWINCSRKSKPFNHRYELLVHMRIHGGEKPHKCPFQGCNKAFSCLQNLNKHQNEHTGERLYSCEFSTCCKTFSRLFHKMTHQRVHDKHYTEEEVTQETVESKGKGGDFVLEESSNSSNEAKHEKMHHNACKWEDCYQTCDSQMDLVKHIKKDHVQLQSGEEFTCLWTNCRRKCKPFNRRYELLLHMRVHSGEKPHKCSFQDCNKAFSLKYSLKVHQRSHTGEKPYKCQFSNCFKSFSTSSYRSAHQKLHYINPQQLDEKSC